jgi:hypothetical protein
MYWWLDQMQHDQHLSRILDKIAAKEGIGFTGSTGMLTWMLISLDPTTGLPPEDPTVGFLDPGVTGSVLCTVRPKPNLQTGTVVTNQARIIFDNNEPLNTNIWSNKLDNDTPVSAVTQLSTNQKSAAFPVSRQGTDEGSGISDFTIYVSDNGGPYTAWQTQVTATQATSQGSDGHTYRFYSIARDLTVNEETSKVAGEAVTTVLPDTAPTSPADTNNDWRFSIDEITAYATAWKRGDPWQTGPNPIPMDYVTNVGALWKTGEQYHYDSNKNPPLCWIAGGSGGASLLSQAVSPLSATARNDKSQTGSVAANVMIATGAEPGAGEIEILVVPSATVQVYAVEETVPSGWDILVINEGGEYDRVRRKVRWGPFFDNASRTLTYTVSPAGRSRGTIGFAGVASFDGRSVPIRHNTSVSDPGVRISK